MRRLDPIRQRCPAQAAAFVSPASLPQRANRSRGVEPRVTHPVRPRSDRARRLTSRAPRRSARRSRDSGCREKTNRASSSHARLQRTKKRSSSRLLKQLAGPRSASAKHWFPRSPGQARTPSGRPAVLPFQGGGPPWVEVAGEAWAAPPPQFHGRSAGRGGPGNRVGRRRGA